MAQTTDLPRPRLAFNDTDLELHLYVNLLGLNQKVRYCSDHKNRLAV